MLLGVRQLHASFIWMGDLFNYYFNFNDHALESHLVPITYSGIM